MDSSLLVLGSCGAFPEAGRACSGYVLEHHGFRTLIDLGYGTVSRLLHHVGSSIGDGVDAVVISHEHPDHMHDLHALFRARLFRAGGTPPIPLYAPAGVMTRLGAVEDDDPETVARVFAWHPLPGTYVVGPWRLTGIDLPHFVPNSGVRLESPDLVVAYTGDTGPTPLLLDLARDADLLVSDASDPHQQESAADAPDREFLLSARAAAEVARDARARRLVLTHFLPGNDRQLSRRDAEAVFGGEIILADEALTVPLPFGP